MQLHDASSPAGSGHARRGGGGRTACEVPGSLGGFGGKEEKLTAGDGVTGLHGALTVGTP